MADSKVGLAAGRYSATSRPDLYRTPQALQSVFGPNGPVRHCGVFSEAQCRHFLPGVSLFSLFLYGAVFVARGIIAALAVSVEQLLSEDDVAGERWRRREDQSQGAVRERLLRALPGTDTSERNAGGETSSVMFWRLAGAILVTEERVSVMLLAAAVVAEVLVAEMR